MSTVLNKISNGYKLHMEMFDSAMEVADKCSSRSITDSRFHDMQNGYCYSSWNGVGSYAEAIYYMRNGYQPTVESMRGVFKAGKGEGTRFSFRNDIQGFAPVVPLALKGVPNSMVSMTMKPIKAKVVDVYYDMTASCSVKSDDIIAAGQTLLGSVIELERQGYRFNLYAVQTYSDSHSADVMVVRVKSASQPLDLKRVSFTLTHTAFFRTMGFDWYSKMPGGTYRSGYGSALMHNVSKQRADAIFKDIFGKNALYFSAVDIMRDGKGYITEAMSNGNSKG